MLGGQNHSFLRPEGVQVQGQGDVF
jgi:hypothetical protein